MTRRPRISSEEGAEIVEFAIILPLFLFVLFGLLYGLIAVTAHMSLANAATRAVRYASIPADPVSNSYPSVGEVATKIDDESPFFAVDDCKTTVSGASVANAVVVLDVACDFPNPFGGVLHALKNLITNSDDPDESGTDLRMSARADARRE